VVGTLWLLLLSAELASAVLEEERGRVAHRRSMYRVFLLPQIA
jgi:hypothetical protein